MDREWTITSGIFAGLKFPFGRLRIFVALLSWFHTLQTIPFLVVLSGILIGVFFVLLAVTLLGFLTYFALLDPLKLSIDSERIC